MIKLSDYELGWLVALLEGEGCFRIDTRNCLGITVNMTDKDVVETYCSIVAKVIDKYPHIRCKPTDRIEWHETWCAEIHGQSARLIMQLVVPHMHYRRRARIWQCLNGHKEKKVDLNKILGLKEDING